jgi:hypothetical protein
MRRRQKYSVTVTVTEIDHDHVSRIILPGNIENCCRVVKHA